MSTVRRPLAKPGKPGNASLVLLVLLAHRRPALLDTLTRRRNGRRDDGVGTSAWISASVDRRAGIKGRGDKLALQRRAIGTYCKKQGLLLVDTLSDTRRQVEVLTQGRVGLERRSCLVLALTDAAEGGATFTRPYTRRSGSKLRLVLTAR
jgi:hypothetical protein